MRNKVVVLFFILIASCKSFSIYENNNTYEKIGFAEVKVFRLMKTIILMRK